MAAVAGPRIASRRISPSCRRPGSAAHRGLPARFQPTVEQATSRLRKRGSSRPVASSPCVAHEGRLPDFAPGPQANSSRKKAAASRSEARASSISPCASCQQCGTHGQSVQLRLHAGRSRSGGVAQRVVAQQLILGDMNEQGRQTGKLCIERRRAGVARTRARKISARRNLQHLAREHRIPSLVLARRGASHGEIGPGRKQRRGAGQAFAVLAAAPP